MRSPVAFLRYTARASLDFLHIAPGGNLAEVLPDAVARLWRWWSKGKTEQWLREELQTLATIHDIRELTEEIIAEEAASLDVQRLSRLETWFAVLPAAIRRAQKRPADPTGRTIAPQLSLRRWEDLLPLFPTRQPRFAPGQQAPGFVEWTLEEWLGSGDFGEVWKGVHPTLPPTALRFCLDHDAAARLLAEPDLLATLARHGRHPNMSVLLDAALEAEPPCLKYEYVAGGDLGTVIRLREMLPIQQIVALLNDLATAIGTMHRLNPPLAHGNLKPSSVILEVNSTCGSRPRITDFATGSLLLLEIPQQATVFKGVRGANRSTYVPSPRIRGATPQPTDDLYAIGVIGYQLLSGHLQGPVEGWRELLAEQRVGEELLAILEDCLSVGQLAHPLDAQSLADRFGQLLGSSNGVALVPPPPRPVNNSLGMEMALILPGRRRIDSGTVEVTQAFYIGVAPVTQQQYHQVTGKNPSWFSNTGRGEEQVRGLDTTAFPVESVSWEEAVAFCQCLSERPEEVKEGRTYRLPSETEWEYACSAGFEAPGGHLRTQAVSEGPANRFGVIDARGNVWEWCDDLFTEVGRVQTQPTSRVLRGRSWSNFGARKGTTARRPGAPGLRSNGIGFRVVMTLTPA